MKTFGIQRSFRNSKLTGDQAPWNKWYFSRQSTCIKLIIMCVCMIVSAAKSMFSYVFDCIISFYPIFLPLHRKVPGIKMILSRSKRTFALIWRKYYKKKMTLSWCQTYIDMVMENSLSLTLSMSRISTFISTCTCIMIIWLLSFIFISTFISTWSWIIFTWVLKWKKIIGSVPIFAHAYFSSKAHETFKALFQNSFLRYKESIPLNTYFYTNDL